METKHPELVPHRFLPGQSGNPNGRPRGIVAVAKALTHDGADLSRFMWRIYRGKSLGKKEVSRVVVAPDGSKSTVQIMVTVYPTVDQRMEAATWLAERGWGKPRQTHELVSKRITVFRQSDGTPLALQPATEEPIEPPA